MLTFDSCKKLTKNQKKTGRLSALLSALPRRRLSSPFPIAKTLQIAVFDLFIARTEKGKEGPAWLGWGHVWTQGWFLALPCLITNQPTPFESRPLSLFHALFRRLQLPLSVHSI